MQLPYFFEENIPESGNFFLSEESSKHIVQVLRMKEGEEINITNGKGELLISSVVIANKRRTEVTITNRICSPRSNQKIAIAISSIKNNNRFEWFLEKATEIGVSEIILLICNRTEKNPMKMDRMHNIIVSATLQSRQAWMPELKEPVKFTEIIKSTGYHQKFIAHCNDSKKKTLKDFDTGNSSRIILIGPEGDFTENEITAAGQNNFIPVSLGETRLRTETAGIVAAVLIMNKF